MDDGFVSRREFVAGCAGGVASAMAARTGLAADLATVAPADLLADYVGTRDPSTAVETLGSGTVAGGRWRTCRLTSQTWKGAAWTHEVSMFLPTDVQDTSRGSSGSTAAASAKVPAEGLAEPTDAVQDRGGRRHRRGTAGCGRAAGAVSADVRRPP